MYTLTRIGSIVLIFGIVSCGSATLKNPDGGAGAGGAPRGGAAGGGNGGALGGNGGGTLGGNGGHGAGGGAAGQAGAGGSGTGGGHADGSAVDRVTDAGQTPSPGTIL